MADFHAFADMSQLLGTQSSTESFGAKGIDEFRLTSSFNITTDVKAFAVITGTVLIQPVDSTEDPSGELVNLIIKPFLQSTINFSPVKYFIYRGLKRSDFVDNNDNVQLSGTEFINELNEIQNERNTIANTNDIIPLETLFGHNLTPNMSDLIDDFFFTSDDNIQLANINGGTYLGDYKGNESVGFEIILENPSYFPDIGMARKLVHKIEINTSDTVQKKRKDRELTLNFIDPSSYYGMHFEENRRVGAKNDPSPYDPSIHDIQGDSIYDVIIQQFETRNIIYLDIRSDNGYSLNYYQNYEGSPDADKEIQIALTPSAPAQVNYYNIHNWPFHVIADAGNTSTNENEYALTFPMNDNPSPLLFAEHANIVSISTGNFIATEDLVQSPPNDWSESIVFKVPNPLGVSTSEKQVSTIVKLHFIRQIDNNISQSTNVVPTKRFTDQVFGPIGVNPNWNTSDSTQWVTGFHKKYIDASAKGKLAFDKSVKIIDEDTTPDNRFLVGGNIAVDFEIGQTINVVGSTSNDGAYTVDNVFFDGTQTIIVVNESISNTSPVNHGDLEFEKDMDIAGINTIDKEIFITGGRAFRDADTDPLRVGEINPGDIVTITNSPDNNGSYVVDNMTINSDFAVIRIIDSVPQSLRGDMLGFGYMSQTGVSTDVGRRIFYAVPNEYNSLLFGPQTPNPIVKNMVGGVSSRTSFFLEMKRLLPDLILEGVTLDLAPSPNVATLSYTTKSGKVVPFGRNNFIALGISDMEFNNITNAANNSNLSDLHDKYLILKPSTNVPVGFVSGDTLMDNNGENYKKYELFVAGLDNNGEYLTVSGSPNIEIYSTDGLLFTSQEFANTEDLFKHKNDKDEGLLYEEQFSDDAEPLAILSGDPNMLQHVNDFQNAVIATNNLSDIESHVENYGKLILEQAYNYSKQNPTSPDDRPLYWARLRMRVALRNHPQLENRFSKRMKLIDKLDEVSRGIHAVKFKPIIEIVGLLGDEGHKRVIESTFNGNDTILKVEENLTNSSPSGEIQYTHYVEIIGVDVVNDTITVANDFTSELISGDSIAITQSTGNNNSHTIDTIILDSGNTIIKVLGNIGDANSDGKLAFLRKKNIDGINTSNNEITISNEDIVEDIEKSTLNILISGFDKFGSIDSHNPAGIVALSLHNKIITNANNVVFAHLQSCGIFPVSWRYFNNRFIESAFKPYIKEANAVNAVVTISLDAPIDSIQIDRFLAKTRGSGKSRGNENLKGNKFPPLLRAKLHYETTLPFVPMIALHSGNYILHLDQSYKPGGPSCDPFEYITYSNPNQTPISNSNFLTNSTSPSVPSNKLDAGSGGGYMSNEIAYRVARLRDLYNPNLSTGHLHVPGFGGWICGAPYNSLTLGDTPDVVVDVESIFKNMLLYLK